MTKDEALKLALEWLETDDSQKIIMARHFIKEALAQPAVTESHKQEPVAWDGGEAWESLAWELCADENGEDSCNELIWEGGPIPEPWGDRWMKYEHEAKRLIAIVQKHTTPPQRTWVGLTDDEVYESYLVDTNMSKEKDWVLMFYEVIEAKLKEKNT